MLKMMVIMSNYFFKDQSTAGVNLRENLLHQETKRKKKFYVYLGINGQVYLCHTTLKH